MSATAMCSAVEPRRAAFEAGGRTYEALCWRANGTSRATREPLVLLHGFSQRASSWAEVAPLLAKGHNGDGVMCASPSLPGGCGRDVWAIEYVDAGACDYESLVEVVAAACRVAGGRVALVGYSMGGRVALGVAQAHPELLGALVLEGAGLGPADASACEAARARDAEIVRRLREGPIEAFVDWWEARPVFASQRLLAPERRALLRQARLSCDFEALARCVEGAGQHAMPCLAHVPGRLVGGGVPVLYVAGERDEKYAQVAHGLADAGVAVRIMPGVGHNVHFESPAEYAELLATWLAAAGAETTRGER